MSHPSLRAGYQAGLVRKAGDQQSHPLDAIFRPRSVAIVGASPWQFGASGAGAAFIRALQELDFPLIYPVNSKHEEIEGLRCYPDLASIDGPVDHVISAVPAKAVPGVLEQAIAKGARTLHLFTAGFTETGDDGSAEIEEQVAARAVQAGVRVLGPNCMGLYVPAARLSFTPGMPSEPGPVAMISQSGTNAGEMVRSSATRGIRYSKVISYGNGSDIGANELLDYLATDEETEIITAYIEGVRDGRGLVRALGKAAAVKPVIVLKGGRTGAGERAAYSHTASLAGARDVFDAVCRQTGAIQVTSVEEMTSDPEGFIGSTVREPEAAREASGKPIIVVANQALDVKAVEHTLLFQEYCRRSSIPVYPTIPRAAAALAAYLRWMESRDAMEVAG